MIVCNLLQNSQSSDAGRQLAAPILKELMSLPGLSSNTLSPNLIGPNIVSPNFPSNVITNYLPPNVVGPNLFAPNFASPNPTVISPNMLSLPPRFVAPGNPCPNAPQLGPADVNGLLNTLMGMLGNIRG